MIFASRDRNGVLAFFSERPQRNRDHWWRDGVDSCEWSEEFGPDPLPDLTWEEEPVEVVIAIMRK